MQSPSIQALLAEQRLEEAAALAAQQGELSLAEELYLRACAYESAGRVAERAGAWDRAALAFAEAGAIGEIERIVPELRTHRELAERAAFRLAQRGSFLAEGLVRESLDDFEPAARAFEAAGLPRRAAELLERIGETVAAGRVLEAALRRDPRAWDCALWLGELLLRHGKPEAAVRALQKIPADRGERRPALAAMAMAYERLGLPQARSEVLGELQHLGPGSLPPAAPSSHARSSGSTPSQLLFGRYTILEEVHRSSSTRVLRCTDSLRGDDVAVKLFVAQDLRGTGRDALIRFEREIQLLRALTHAHVVEPREYVPEGPAVVTEWLAGGSLADLMQRESIAPRRAVEITAAVLAALGEAHLRGILHRDIKPANVLFDAAGTPKLADFGVAHLGDASGTVTAGLIGTFAYMSPEQRRGQPAVVQSDLYAAGVLLQEMLTGNLPEHADAARPSAFHRELGAAHDQALATLLAAQPGERPESAAAALRLLRGLSWPAHVDRVVVPQPKPERPSDPRASGRARYRQDAEGVWTCNHSGRRVERHPLHSASSQRAQHFARCSHRALQAVLTADAEAGVLWLELPAGRPLQRAPSPRELEELEAALDELHRHRLVHGHVELDHLWETRSGVLLRYAPEAPMSATSDDDRRALHALRVRV